MKSRTSLAIAALAGIIMVTGCANIRDIDRRITSRDLISKKPPDAGYVVDPPDAISVEFLQPPAPTREATLRSDGCITLPYLEDVKVGGLTPVEIREKLEKLYTRYYQDPRMLVTVTGYNSKHVYVYGEVGRRGAVAYTGDMTVSDLMGKVGGFTSRAAAWRAYLVRRDPEHKEVFRINLRSLMYRGDVRQEVSLAENDVVYVPPTVLAWVGYQLESILFPLSGATSVSRVSTGLVAP